MARLKIRHLIQKPGRKGAIRYFWQPGPALRRLGWRGQALKDADGKFLPLAQAIQAAEALNAQLDAWRQGERADGAPGKPPVAGSVQALIDAYLANPRFANLAAATQHGYRDLCRMVGQWAGDVPMAAITPARVQALYEQLYPQKPSRANHLITMIRILFGFAARRGWVLKNPAEKPGLIGTPSRARFWSVEALNACVTAADRMHRPSLAAGILMAGLLGQRPTDVRTMVRTSYQDGFFLFRQSKTEELIKVRALLDLQVWVEKMMASHNHATILVNEMTGLPYTEDALAHTFALVRAAAMQACPDLATELQDLQFRDLRRTGIIWLAIADCTIPQIAAISGHSIAYTTRIIDTYLPRNAEVANAGIAKLEAYREAKGLAAPLPMAAEDKPAFRYRRYRGRAAKAKGE